MPIYEYACETCGKEFEHLQRFTDAPLRECLCEKQGTVIRKLSLSAFQLKGGGWYKEGYSAPNPKAAAEKKGAKGEKSEKGETKGSAKTTEKSKKENATTVKNKSASS